MITYIPKLIFHPKWFNSDKDTKKDTKIVLFLMSEKELCNEYQYGMSESVPPGIDGKVRIDKVKYRN